MADSANGKGAANNASVSVGRNAGVSLVDEADAAVAAAENKVSEAKAGLASAEDALRQAKADRKALG